MLRRSICSWPAGHVSWGWLQPRTRSTRLASLSPYKAMVPRTPVAGVAAEEPARLLDNADFSKDWLDFGRAPPHIPPLVKKLIIEVKSLEDELGEKLVFGGPRGSLQGRAKAAEEHRHRAFYGYLPDGEEKLQFYSARQVACRILGCKGYLCKDVISQLQRSCLNTQAGLIALANKWYAVADDW